MLNKKNIRELAYVAEVTEIKPIEGSDNCECAAIGGWNVMVKKGEYKVGDKCVYFEIDSLVDTNDERFAFMARYHGKVKTQKFTFGGKGLFYSQGLIMKLSEVGLNESDYKVGDFLTETLNVKYYEQESQARKGNESRTYKSSFNKIKKNKLVKKLMRYKWFRELMFAIFGQKKKKRDFPNFVVISDEERCLSSRTEVLTDKGKLLLGTIVNNKINAKVLSANQDGELEYKKIVGYQKIKREEPMCEIRYLNYNNQATRNLSVCCTLDHKFLTERGYIEAKYLTSNDWLLNKSVGGNMECLSAIYGLLLGDGCYQMDKRANNEHTGRLTWTQSISHSRYTEYIKKLFGNNLKEYIFNSEKGFSNIPIIRYSFDRNNTLNAYLLKDNAIKDKKKYISREYCDRISPLGLALWFMDDGTKKIHKNKTVEDKCTMEIATNAYSEEENKNLVDMLQNKYGIRCKYYLTNKGYWQIYIYDEGTRRLTELIGKYVPSSMRYKLNPFVEANYPFEDNFESFSFDNDILLPTKVVANKLIKHKIPKHFGCDGYVYDITVEDNHNFFANNVLTHNCQNLPLSVFTDKETTYNVTEKVDGSSTTVAIQRLNGTSKMKSFICSRRVCVWDSKTNKIKKGGYYAGTIESNPYVDMAEKYHLVEFLEKYMKQHKEVQWAYIQGETYGQKIQKRDYGLKGRDFRAFTFVDSCNGRYTYTETKDILGADGIPVVPILETGWVIKDNADEVVALAQGKSEIDGGAREGLVFRSEQNPQFSFKAVDPEFLIKYHG